MRSHQERDVPGIFQFSDREAQLSQSGSNTHFRDVATPNAQNWSYISVILCDDRCCLCSLQFAQAVATGVRWITQSDESACQLAIAGLCVQPTLGELYVQGIISLHVCRMSVCESWRIIARHCATPQDTEQHHKALHNRKELRATHYVFADHSMIDMRCPKIVIDVLSY